MFESFSEDVTIELGFGVPNDNFDENKDWKLSQDNMKAMIKSFFI